MNIGSKIAGAALVVGALAASPASAATVLVQGLGMFNASAPTTSFSAPNESFTFAFDLPSPYASSGSFGGGTATMQDTSFSYSLEGTPLNLALSQVSFLPASAGGGLDLQFAGSGNFLKLFNGPDVGSSGTLSSPSFDSYTVDVNDGTANNGNSAVTLTNVSAVPLPPALLLFGTALLSLGAVGYGMRRRTGTRSSAAAA